MFVFFMINSTPYDTLFPNRDHDSRWLRSFTSSLVAWSSFFRLLSPASAFSPAYCLPSLISRQQYTGSHTTSLYPYAPPFLLYVYYYILLRRFETGNYLRIYIKILICRFSYPSKLFDKHNNLNQDTTNVQETHKYIRETAKDSQFLSARENAIIMIGNTTICTSCRYVVRSRGKMLY